jgi:hypothetical protein
VPANERGRVRWIALIATTALIAGLSVAWWLARPQPPPGDGSTPDAGLDPAGSGAGAAPDSAEIKSRWVDEVPGFDLEDLSPARREIFVRFANAQRCTCGCGYTLAACRVYDSTCEVSTPRVQALLDSVRAGRIASASGIRERPY